MNIELSTGEKTTIETALTIANSIVGEVNSDYIDLYSKMRGMTTEPVASDSGIAILTAVKIPSGTEYAIQCPLCHAAIFTCCEEHSFAQVKAHAYVEHGKVAIDLTGK